MRSIEERFWEKVQMSNGCWEWTACRNSISKGGYGFFRVKSRQSMQQAHRVAWQLTYGLIPDGVCVCHRCDNPGCVNPSHLFLGTKLDNARDREEKNRGHDRRGMSHPKARLTDIQIQSIRESLSNRQLGDIKKVAMAYGVSPAHISAIVRRKAWSHI